MRFPLYLRSGCCSVFGIKTPLPQTHVPLDLPGSLRAQFLRRFICPSLVPNPIARKCLSHGGTRFSSTSLNELDAVSCGARIQPSPADSKRTAPMNRNLHRFRAANCGSSSDIHSPVSRPLRARFVCSLDESSLQFGSVAVGSGVSCGVT